MDYYVHPTAIVDEGAVVGINSKIWHFSHLMANSIVGENCILGQNVFVASGVSIGNGVKIQNNVSLYTGVTIEDDVFLGPSMVFTNVMNPRAFIERKEEYRPSLIKKGASIGANATIVCGNEIGEYAFIGAGAVVNKPVLPYQMVAGCPSKHIGWISKAGIKLSFNKDNVAVCNLSGEKYELVGGKVIPIKL